MHYLGCVYNASIKEYIKYFTRGVIPLHNYVPSTISLFHVAVEKFHVAVDLFVLRFYSPVNPMGSCRARSVYLATRLLGRLSPLSV